jgi:glycosyltransferase involved in cell wall biosynthesis
MNKVNVLYVEPSIYTAQVGGSFQSLYYLVRHLDQERYRPTVLFFREHNYLDAFEKAGIDVVVDDRYFRNSRFHALSSGNLTAFSARAVRKLLHLSGISRAERLLRRELHALGVIGSLIRKKDIVLLHANQGLSQDRASILAARRAGIPCVCHQRRYDKINSRTRRLSRHVALSIAVSDGVKESLLRQRVRCGKVIRIYNAVDAEDLAARIRKMKHAAEPHPAGAGFVIGMFGNILRWKGQELLLRAVLRIRDAVPGLKVIFVGGLADTDAPYYGKLKAMVGGNSLGEIVTFTGYRNDVYELMHSCDIVVHASLRPEPFGRVIAEAQVVGAAVLAPRCGGAAELIEDDVNGLLFEAGDPQDLAERILELYRDGQRRRRLGEAARLSAPVKFDARDRTADIQQAYDELLGWSRP